MNELEIVTEFLQQHPKVSTIELLISDLNGVIRGKRIQRSLLKKVFESGFYLPGSVMSLDATGSTVEEAGQGLEIGDCDFLCKPIARTLSIVPWHEQGDRAQVLCTMFNKDETPYFADPRHILLQAVERFSMLGYTPGIALELEFYLVDPERDDAGQLQAPIIPGTSRRMTSKQVYSLDDLDDYDFFIRDVLDFAKIQNIPADTVIAEYAPGQFEVNLDYGADIMTAVDNTLLLKRLIQCVAKKHKMLATFMAKPYIDEAGNGLHMHLSLLDQEGKNIFASEQSELGSALLQSAIAGLLSLADSSVGFFCPSVNSFRRFAPDAFAPTSKTWGFDNRSVALRIPAGDKKATRIEHRISGADANPYLATTCLLAGVVEGIQNKMAPPPAVVGNAYEQSHELVPDNARDALRFQDQSDVIRSWFGSEFVDLYQTCKWSEVTLFERQVTELEYTLLLPYT